MLNLFRVNKRVNVPSSSHIIILPRRLPMHEYLEGNEEGFFYLFKTTLQSTDHFNK